MKLNRNKYKYLESKFYVGAILDPWNYYLLIDAKDFYIVIRKDMQYMAILQSQWTYNGF